MPEITFCLSKSTINSFTFPVYGYEYSGPQLSLPFEQRYRMFKLSYRATKWCVQHAIEIDETVIQDLICQYDAQIPLDIRCTYYGVIQSRDLTWIAVRFDGALIPNPFAVTKSNVVEGSIVLCKNRFLLVNSPRFHDYFTAIFFNSRGSPNTMTSFRNHLAKFKDMIYDWEGYRVINRFLTCQNEKRVKTTKLNAIKIMSMFSINLSDNEYNENIRDLINTIKHSFVKEIVSIYSKKEENVHLQLCGSIISLFKSKPTFEQVNQIIVSSNNYYKMMIIEYLQIRSKLIQSMAESPGNKFHLNNPYLLISEIILRD